MTTKKFDGWIKQMPEMDSHILRGTQLLCEGRISAFQGTIESMQQLIQDEQMLIDRIGAELRKRQETA